MDSKHFHTQNHPVISVLIPCYRGGKFLEMALESVLKQTYSDYEIVLVDNNSTPETKEVISSFSSRYPQLIRVFQEKNAGACFARNTGIHCCRGEYIALIDDDDFMYPERLSKQLFEIENHQNLSLVSCGIDFFESPSTPDHGTILRKNVIGPSGKTRIYRDLILSKVFSLNPPHEKPDSFFFSLPSKWLIRKKAAINAGLFDLRMNPHWADDIEFLTRLFEQGPFFMIPESLAAFRNLSPSSGTFQYRTGTEIDFKKSIQDSKFLALFYERYRNSSSKTLSVFKKIYSFHLKMHGLEFLEFFHASFIGRVFLIRAFFINPFNYDNFKQMVKSWLPRFLFPRLFWFRNFSMNPFPKTINKSIAFEVFSYPPERIENIKHTDN